MKVLAVAYKFGTMDEIGKNLGSFDYFLNQLVELNKSGVEITVLAPWVKWFKPGSTSIEGVKIIRYWPKLATKSWRNLLGYKLINKLYIWRTGQLTRKYAEELNVDTIYVRQARETGYAVANIKLKLKVPIVFQPITTWRWHFEESKEPMWKNIAKDTVNQKKYADKILKTFDYFVTYTNAMVDEYVAMGADKNKFSIIPPAVKHDFFKPLGNKAELRKELNLPLDKRIVINVGRINLKEKGQTYLLEGFRQVVDQNSNTYLVIIGPGTTEQVGKLNSKIKELNLQDSVSYLGSKPYKDLPKYMSASDVGILPSIWFEAFGRTILDMMSCGLPMVTTKMGGMSEANLHNQTGLNIEPKNSSEIANALIKIISDDNLRATMGENARQRVLDVYTFEKVITQFKEVFNKVI